MRKRSPILAALVLALLAAAAAQAQTADRSDGRAVPRFVSLRSDEVNLRTGPGLRYPVDWVLAKKHLPVEVVAEFETWRKIREPEGAEGWVHQSMLTGKRFVLVAGETREIKRKPERTAPIVARAEAGVLAELLECEGPWCRVEAGGFKGWIGRREVWGVYPTEQVK